MVPIYEYECEKCACLFEIKRSFVEDEGSPRCPQCRGKVRRLFPPPVIIFKGSGFYITDNRSDHNSPSEEGKKEEGKTDKVEEGKKEDGNADKVDGVRKEEGKAYKVQSGKKSESK